MPPKSHSLLSPSASFRWLKCTKSPLFEQEFPEEESEASQLGTVAHSLAEAKLSRKLKLSKKRNPKNDLIDEEMQEYTDQYADFVNGQFEVMKKESDDAFALIEEELDLSEFIPETKGTADCILCCDKTLQIIDFKYGRGISVNAENNTQLSIYALGAISELNALYPFEDVKLTIYQPCINNIATWCTTVNDLTNWCKEVLIPKAQLALKGEGEYSPSYETCRFCKARFVCRARASKVLQDLRLAKSSDPKELKQDEIETLLPLIPSIEKFCKDINTFAYEKAMAGITWHGYKLVHGRSTRRFSDEEKVAEICQNNGFTDIFTKSLIGVPKMEKLLGKKKFEELLGTYTIKPDGKLTLVPESDKRHAVVINATEDFKDIKEEK